MKNLSQKTTAPLIFGGLIFALLTSVGCGPHSGFEAAQFSSKCEGADCDDRAGLGNQDPEPIPDLPLPDLDFKAKHTGSNDNMLAATINQQEESLTLYLPLSSFFALGEVEGESPQLPGLRFETEWRADGSSTMLMHIPLKYLVKEPKFLDPARLPNGDGLPGIPEGELPSLSLGVLKNGSVNLYIYIGYSVAAVYITAPFDPTIRFQFAIRDQERQQVVGYFASVPEKGPYQGGFFMSTVLPDDVARLLDSHFQVE